LNLRGQVLPKAFFAFAIFPRVIKTLLGPPHRAVLHLQGVQRNLHTLRCHGHRLDILANSCTSFNNDCKVSGSFDGVWQSPDAENNITANANFLTRPP